MEWERECIEKVLRWRNAFPLDIVLKRILEPITLMPLRPCHLSIKSSFYQCRVFNRSNAVYLSLSASQSPDCSFCVFYSILHFPESVYGQESNQKCWSASYTALIPGFCAYNTRNTPSLHTRKRPKPSLPRISTPRTVCTSRRRSYFFISVDQLQLATTSRNGRTVLGNHWNGLKSSKRCWIDQVWRPDSRNQALNLDQSRLTISLFVSTTSLFRPVAAVNLTFLGRGTSLHCQERRDHKRSGISTLGRWNSRPRTFKVDPSQSLLLQC